MDETERKALANAWAFHVYALIPAATLLRSLIGEDSIEEMPRLVSNFLIDPCKNPLSNNRAAVLQRRAIDDGLAYRISPFEFFMGAFNIVEYVSSRNLNR